MPFTQRGEAIIRLGEQDYTLRISHEAVDRFETRTGKGIIEFTAELRMLKVKTRDLLVLIEECIRAAGGKAPEKLGDLVLRGGTARIVGNLKDILAYVLNGEVEDTPGQGEAGAAAQ